MTVSWEQTDKHAELIYYRGSLGGGLSAGAEADGRQPGYFLRQRSKARGHLTDMYTERASKREPSCLS